MEATKRGSQLPSIFTRSSTFNIKTAVSCYFAMFYDYSIVVLFHIACLKSIQCLSDDISRTDQPSKNVGQLRTNSKKRALKAICHILKLGPICFNIQQLLQWELKKSLTSDTMQKERREEGRGVWWQWKRVQEFGIVGHLKLIRRRERV